MGLSLEREEEKEATRKQRENHQLPKNVADVTDQFLKITWRGHHSDSDIMSDAKHFAVKSHQVSLL